MRIRRSSDGLAVYAVAGTDVVLLGFNLPKNRTADLMGFAIRRTDHERGETYWLDGFKRFPSTDPGTPAGQGVSTRNHPIQSFQWADYTVRPGQRFSYEVYALRGTPAALTESQHVRVDVDTEARDASTHRVWFNRGAASSQAYVRRFGNRTPEDVGQAAFDWLSRGLFEAYESFLARASSSRWTVRAALYECHYKQALLPLREAKQRGADVRIVYDARDAELRAKNEEALGQAGLRTRAREDRQSERDRPQQIHRAGRRRPSTRGMDRVNEPQLERNLRTIERRPLGRRCGNRCRISRLLGATERRSGIRRAASRRRCRIEHR
jgi:hypothetical protein